jgi:hypothetical protein
LLGWGCGCGCGRCDGVYKIVLAACVRPLLVQVAHTTLQLRVDDVTGVTSLTLTVVVSGQSSNTVTVAVTPPALTALRLYDTATLVRATSLASSTSRGAHLLLLALPGAGPECCVPSPFSFHVSLPSATQPASIQANDNCALVVGDVNVNTTLEVDGSNLGYNTSFFSMALTDVDNVYVAAGTSSPVCQYV